MLGMRRSIRAYVRLIWCPCARLFQDIGHSGGSSHPHDSGNCSSDEIFRLIFAQFRPTYERVLSQSERHVPPPRWAL
ncbi:hypothetical protein VTK56DRAFT_10204 [Thermocarpiscus australiensis]